MNSKVDYPTSPPAGGNHNAVWQNCGFLHVVGDERIRSALARTRCGVDHLHRSIDQTVKNDLAAKAKASPYVLVSLYPDNPTPIVVTAWARQLRLATYDSALIDKFIDVYGVAGPTIPEKRGACRGGIGIPPDRPTAR